MRKLRRYSLNMSKFNIVIGEKMQTYFKSLVISKYQPFPQSLSLFVTVF